MRTLIVAAVLTVALSAGARAAADHYQISFTISTAIDNVFVYADEWNGQVYAWDLFPIPLGTVPAGTTAYDLGTHNVAAWAVLATYGSQGVATSINNGVNPPPDGRSFEAVFPTYTKPAVRDNLATLYVNGAFNVQPAYYLTEFVLAVEDTLKTDFPTGTIQVYTFSAGVHAGTLTVTTGPAVCRGDCSCDGMIDFRDINPFVAVLAGGQPCRFENCDVNGDGRIDFQDINPFVYLLSSGATCP